MEFITKNISVVSIIMIPHNLLHSSCITFCVKIFKTNQPILVCRYWKILVWRYESNMDPKNHTRKIDKIHILKSSYIIFCTKMFGDSHHILTKCLDIPIMSWKHALKTFLPLPPRFYYLPTLSTKIGSISFFYLLGSSNPTILLNALFI